MVQISRLSTTGSTGLVQKKVETLLHTNLCNKRNNYGGPSWSRAVIPERLRVECEWSITPKTVWGSDVQV